MSSSHLTKLWAWISAGCFAYVVGSVIVIQGGNDIFGAKLLADVKKDGREIVAYFAVIIGAGLLCLAFVVAILYARRHGNAWHNRIPVVLLDGLDTATCGGKIFQLVAIVILVILPLCGVGRAMVVANEGVICEQVAAGEAPIQYMSGAWRLINLPPPQHPGAQRRLMTHDTRPETCGGSGVEVNWYTPPAFGGLPALSVGLFVAWIAFLFWPPTAPAASPQRVNPGDG